MLGVKWQVWGVGWRVVKGGGYVDGPRLSSSSSSSSRIQDLDIQSEYESTFDRYVESKGRRRKGGGLRGGGVRQVAACKYQEVQID